MCKFRRIYEWCPYCEQEVRLKSKLAVQKCPNCGKSIVPCSICEDMNCEECPLDMQAELENGENAD